MATLPRQLRVMDDPEKEIEAHNGRGDRLRDIGGKESGQDWYYWGMSVDTWIAIEIHVKQEVNHANKVISTVHATDYEPGEAKGDCVEGEEDDERVQISRGSCTFMAHGGAAVGLHVDYCWLWKTVRLQVHWWSRENNGSVLARTRSNQKSGKGKGRGCVQDMVCLSQWEGGDRIFQYGSHLFLNGTVVVILSYPILSKLNKSGYLRIPSTCP